MTRTPAHYVPPGSDRALCGLHRDHVALVWDGGNPARVLVALDELGGCACCTRALRYRLYGAAPRRPGRRVAREHKHRWGVNGAGVLACRRCGEPFIIGGGRTP